MDYSNRPARIASALGGRLLLLGLALVALLQLVQTSRHAGSALMVAIVVAALLYDLGRRLAAPSALVAPAILADPHLAARLDRMQALVDTVPVILLTLDRSGGLTLVNRAAQLFAGIDAARLEDIPGFGPAAARSLRDLPVGGRTLLTLADGRSFSASVTRFRAQDTPPQSLLALQAVVGDLDAVQVESWRSAFDLLAHEMMNAITPIASLSESVARLAGAQEDHRPQIGAAASTIARRSDHLLGLVERFRSVTDDIVLQRQAIDLQALLADIVALEGNDLHERGIALLLDRSNIPPILEADPGLLQQALVNLVRNAGDAVEGLSDAKIEIICVSRGESIHIAVRDNGPSIAMAEIEQVFLPFFTTKPHGSGIGLPFARRIIAGHGGNLIARRNPDRGMTFELSMPARQS